MGRAIDDIQRASDSTSFSDKQAYIDSFVNCIKAIVRMRSIERWDNLATERGLMILTLGNLVTPKNELNEKTIKTFTENQLKNETILEISVPENEKIARHHTRIDSTHMLPFLDRESSMSISLTTPTSPNGLYSRFF